MDYFEKNRERMRYGCVHQHGFCIGSGVMEAACKTGVTQHLKSAGIHCPNRAYPMSIRTALRSMRYNQVWNHLLSPT